MIATTGYFATPHGSKYLQQLCKHFAHKVEVSYDARSARCEMPFGTALMEADEAGLTVVLQIADPAGLEKARGVIDRHLAIFAHREGFAALDWQPPVPA